MDTSLVCGVEDVIGPRVVVAIDVVIDQIRITVVQGRVPNESVSGGVEEENSYATIVVGYVVLKSIVASAVQGEAMLVVSCQRIINEQVLLGRVTQVRCGEITIHRKAEEVSDDGDSCHFRRVDALKVNTSTEICDNAWSLDGHVRLADDRDTTCTVIISTGASDGVTVQIKRNVTCVDR